ncbi:MAG: carbohydrate-binding family 9-like protein [Candidatus Latescibacteria bacterium]|nr:carbohydrate-binding family 9-like protein [Candidatus Latescibacterota bacterium]
MARTKSQSPTSLGRCLALTAAITACATTAPVIGGPTPDPPSSSFSEAPLPHYLVRHATEPILVDGRLDEFDWAAAPQINGLERILNDYGHVLHATRARMVWDDDALYIAFACRDPDMWALYTEEDDPMWSEEVVEAFIDPDGDGLDYLEVEVNPLNAIVDLHISSVQPAWVSAIDWDIAGLRTAVEVHGTVNDSTDLDVGWTVEMAIPWSAYSPTIVGGGRPSVGDRWRLNLYRIERGAGAGVRAALRELEARSRPLRRRLEELGEKESLERTRLEQQLEQIQAERAPQDEAYEDQTEYTAWSPTFQRGFHHPGRFGVIEFTP